MLEQNAVKALALQAEHEPPIDCLRELLRLYREDKLVSVEGAMHALHVITYLLDRIVAEIDNTDDGVIIKPYGIDEFDELVKEFYEELAGEKYVEVKGATAIPSFLYVIVIRLLIAQLPKLLEKYFDEATIAKIQEAIKKLLDELLNR